MPNSHIPHNVELKDTLQKYHRAQLALNQAFKHSDISFNWRQLAPLEKDKYEKQICLIKAAKHREIEKDYISQANTIYEN